MARYDETYKFLVEKGKKTFKIFAANTPENVHKVEQSCINIIFYREVGSGKTTSFNSYYGSQPCYEEDYADMFGYGYSVDFDEISEYIFDDVDYLEKLKQDDPELYHHFYDDEYNWIWDPDEPNSEDAVWLLLINAFEWRDNLEEHVNECAQTAYDKEKESDFDPD